MAMDSLDAFAGMTYEEVAKRLQEQNLQLIEQLRIASKELDAAYESTISGWRKAMELSNLEQPGHAERVAEQTVRLAQAMGMPEEKIVNIRRGALLHDVGMLGISDRILFKTSMLDDDEQSLLKQHPLTAFELLAPIPHLRSVVDIPYAHHEAWDGSGYPRGLKGEEIPLAARIFAVVDVYDSMMSPRPYRPARSQKEALEHLKEQSGIQFDPQVVEAFLKMIEQG